ncbi:hypothetical protein OG216_09545 [Streptomycetaceae bacterium NBC_01309]
MGKATARCAALILTAGMLIAGCSDGGGDEKPAAATAPALNCQDPVQAILCGDVTPVGPPTATPAPPNGPAPANMPPGCNEPTVSPQVWFSVCGQTGPAPGEEPDAPEGPRPLGQAVLTTGSNGSGTLELAPTTVVYSTGQDTGTVPNKDGYVTVTVKLTNKGAVTARDSDFWSYVAPDGEALDIGIIIVPRGFDGGSTIQPGTFQWGSQSWDIRNDQKGGVLVYKDGTDVLYKWQLPAVDTGPQVAEVKKGF